MMRDKDGKRWNKLGLALVASSGLCLLSFTAHAQGGVQLSEVTSVTCDHNGDPANPRAVVEITSKLVNTGGTNINFRVKGTTYAQNGPTWIVNGGGTSDITNVRLTPLAGRKDTYNYSSMCYPNVAIYAKAILYQVHTGGTLTTLHEKDSVGAPTTP